MSNYLTEIIETKIELKENGVSVASSNKLEKIKVLIKLLVERWYEKKKPSKEQIEKIINKIDKKLASIKKPIVKEAIRYFRELLINYIVGFEEIKYTEKVDKGYLGGYTLKVKGYEKVKEVGIKVRYYDEKIDKSGGTWSEWKKAELKGDGKGTYRLLIVPDYEKIEIIPYIKAYDVEKEGKKAVIETPIGALKLKNGSSIASVTTTTTWWNVGVDWGKVRGGLVVLRRVAGIVVNMVEIGFSDADVLMGCDPVYEVKIGNKCLSKEEVERRVKELEKSDFNLRLNNETNVVGLEDILENKVRSTTLGNLWTVFEGLSEEYGGIYERYVKLFKGSSGNSGNNGSEGNGGGGESGSGGGKKKGNKGKSWNIGDKVETPETCPECFESKKIPGTKGKTYIDKSNGDIWSKDIDNHGGSAWKRRPKGTKKFGSSSKAAKIRRSIKGDGTVIGY